MAWAFAVGPGASRESALSAVGKVNAYVGGRERSTMREAQTLLLGMLGPYPLSGYTFEIRASGGEFIEEFVFRATKTN